MLSTELLSREHTEIDAIAVRLLDMVDLPAMPDDGLAALRWRLNHLLAVHLAKEDKHLYPLLCASTDPQTQAIAARFATEMGGLADAYRAYSVKWTAERIAADWAEFGAETRQVLKLLRRRVLHEERDLYPRVALDRRAAA